MAPRGPIPAEPKPEWLTAIVDTREQLPLDWLHYVRRWVPFEPVTIA